MKKEKLKCKLEILNSEMQQASKLVDNFTKQYLYNLQKLVKEYQDQIDKNLLSVSKGGNLGFRRAILEYDDLADIDSLYEAACDVDSYYSNECKEW